MKTWFALSVWFFLGLAEAQTVAARAALPATAQRQPVLWTGFMRYSALSDFADNRKPRAYTQSLGGGTSYQFSENWSLSADLGFRAETVEGQIYKGAEQTYSEVLSPTTALEVAYSHRFNSENSLTTFVHGEPLWDEPSRREGYRGLVGAGLGWNLLFFRGRYSLLNTLDATQLLNTYRYSLDTSPNPDTFVTYRLANAVRIWRTLKFNYTFGLRTTRYLDGFVGYSYSNQVMLSYSWNRLTAALSYNNGAFTEDGQVRLWFIDQYRRVAMLLMNYTF